MGKRYSKSDVVANDLISPNMADYFDVAFIWFEFFDGDPEDEENPPNLVQPTAGTLDVTTSENGFAYATIPNGDGLDVSVADYIRLNFKGPSLNVKCEPDTIPSGGGVTHYRMVVDRSISS